MTYHPQRMSTERALVEHYLFALGQTVEKTAEILDKDEETVRKIYDDYRKYGLTERKSK